MQSWLARCSTAGPSAWAADAGIRVVVMACRAALAALVWTLDPPAPGAGRPGSPWPPWCVGVGGGLWSERPLLFGLLGLGLVAAGGRGPARPPLAGADHVGVGQHPRLVPARPGGRRRSRARSPARRQPATCGSSGSLGAGWPAASLLGAVNPLGPRLLLFPLEAAPQTEAVPRTSSSGSRPIRRTGPGRCSSSRSLVAGPARPAAVVAGRVPLVVFAAPGAGVGPQRRVASMVMLPGMAAGSPGWARRRGTALRRSSGRLGSSRRAWSPCCFSVVAPPAARRPTSTTTRRRRSTWMEDNGLRGPTSRVVAPGLRRQLPRGPLRHRRQGLHRRPLRHVPAEVFDDYLDAASARPGWAGGPRPLRGIDVVLWEGDSRWPSCSGVRRTGRSSTTTRLDGRAAAEDPASPDWPTGQSSTAAGLRSIVSAHLVCPSAVGSAANHEGLGRDAASEPADAAPT